MKYDAISLYLGKRRDGLPIEVESSDSFEVGSVKSSQLPDGSLNFNVSRGLWEAASFAHCGQCESCLNSYNQEA